MLGFRMRLSQDRQTNQKGSGLNVEFDLCLIITSGPGFPRPCDAGWENLIQTTADLPDGEIQ